MTSRQGLGISELAFILAAIVAVAIILFIAFQFVNSNVVITVD
ncbi:MAG: hypothetical protein SVU32_06400 [Candidatus Nanohaloarchaea archaeon]|nr:hypothetical protein [Candidatus Nanohaloarchaea archaeon]